MHSLTRSWLLCLGALSVVAAAPEEVWQIQFADPRYARACPDYKKYSTFLQYVSSIETVAPANF